MNGADTPESPAVGAGALGSGAGLVLLCGLALPVGRGFLLPLFLLSVLAVLAHRLQQGAWSGAARAGGWAAVLARLSPAQRLSIAALCILPLAVLCTVGARAAASLVVAFPAAIWALAALAVAAIAARHVGGRGRAPLLFLLSLGVPMVGVLGARFEASGPEARGFAGSGPILGIHPFQSTAVIVDGYGPYDLPINDYVEPDGSRGYGPEAYADAIELSLHEIAARHFARGPARARRAFADATVESVQGPAVREALDHEPSQESQPRITVWSGTTGQRSRVQFVCPGKQDDPSGIPAEAVMNRMCPTKYIAEASAGLGLTGRWAGYTEARGNERVGLSRAMGWTRSDDEIGRAVVSREVRWGAWILLLVAAALGIAARPQRARAIQGASSAIFAASLVVCALLWIGSGASLQVAAVERVAADARGLDPRAWLPALVVFGGALSWASTGPTAPGRPWARVPAATIAAGTLVVATSVGADAWIRPDLAGDALHLPMESFVAAAADAIGERMGLSILEIEAAVAAVVLALLVGAVISWTSAAGGAGERLFVPSRGRLLGLVVPAVAAALVVSRKTDGAAALVPAAMAAIFVLASGLSLVARRRPDPTDRSGRPDRSARWPSVLHVLSVAGAVWVASASMAELPRSAFVVLCLAIGLLTLLGALVLLAAPRRPGASGPEGPPARLPRAP